MLKDLCRGMERCLSLKEYWLFFKKSWGQHSRGGKHHSVTPLPEGQTTLSDFQRYHAHTWHTYVWAGKAFIHIK